MRIHKGDVVKKKRGGAKRCEVLAVTRTHATLRPLAATAQYRRGAVSSLVVRLDDGGLPEGYEVAE